jgi:methionyl-tRNA formyltransferase
MKVVFIAYREWAIKVYPHIQNHPKVTESIFCRTLDELYELDLSKFDLLITLGLSEKIENNVYHNIETIGLHCAELDRYSYGSPIQLQIIDGIVKTKHRVFRLLSGGENSLRSHAHTREYSDEVDLFLHGGIKEIFDQLTYTSITLFNSFLDSFPNIEWKQWAEEDVVRNRRRPEDSKLSMSQLMQMSTLDLYNLIRCLEDPYPNVHIEDEEGILYFKKVTFKQKSKD